MNKSELLERKQALEAEIATIEETLKAIYASETESAIIEFGRKHGIELRRGMTISSTQSIADYVIKDSPQWVNPPARVGHILTLNYVSSDYTHWEAKPSSWTVAIPITLIKEALESRG